MKPQSHAWVPMDTKRENAWHGQTVVPDTARLTAGQLINTVITSTITNHENLGSAHIQTTEAKPVFDLT